MSGGQRSIASFFGGGGPKPAVPVKPDEAENVPPAAKKPPTHPSNGGNLLEIRGLAGVFVDDDDKGW